MLQQAPKNNDLLARELNIPRRIDTIARKSHRLFLATTAITTICFITWATFMTIDKVKRGSGRIIPQMQNQNVQHLEGGIVTEILVKEGDKVVKDQPLLRIENSFAKAELQQTELDIKTKRVKHARLLAESEGRGEPMMVKELQTAVPRVVDREMSLFKTRREGFKEQMTILDEQVRQKESELQELLSRYKNTTQEQGLVKQRVASLRRLQSMGAVSNNELLDNERQLSQLESKLSDIQHNIPRTQAAINESKNRRLEGETRFRTDAARERNEADHEISKLEESQFALQDRLKRNEVLSPVAGIVNKLLVNTLGGVVKSGEQLVQIVPSDTAITVEARLSPADRAEVWPGLPAVVKVSAYDYSIFGGLHGKVVDISPDAIPDEQGKPYFRVRLEAKAGNFGADKPVLPGMLADVDILAGKQTIMDIILKPVKRIKDNAFRQ